MCDISGCATFFSHYLTNGTIKKIIEYKMCVLIYSTILCKIFVILRRTERDIIINLQRLHVKYTFFMSEFNLLTPNDPYMGRTAPLTSKRCILYIF